MVYISVLCCLSEVLAERYEEAPRRDVLLLVLKMVGSSVYLSSILKATSPYFFSLFQFFSAWLIFLFIFSCHLYITFSIVLLIRCAYLLRLPCSFLWSIWSRLVLGSGCWSGWICALPKLQAENQCSSVILFEIDKIQPFSTCHCSTSVQVIRYIDLHKKRTAFKVQDIVGWSFGL